MPIKRCILTCVCFALSCAASAQYLKLGIDGPIPLASLSEMQSNLDLASADQRADLLARIGVDPALARNIAQNLPPGHDIQLRPVRVPGSTEYGVAFLPGGTGTSCYAYLLAGASDARHPAWHTVDSHPLDCWHGEAVLEVVPLRRADADDLLLHHINKGHGSNSVTDQMQVFSVLNGRLVQTLVTQDYLSENVIGEETIREQVSTFVRFPGSLLEETRTTAEDDKLRKVERRYWRWSPQARKFLASPFVPVIPPRTF